MKHVKSWIKTIKKNVSKNFKYVKENHIIKTYCEENVIFITFVITCVLNSTLLRFFTMHTIENYLSIKAVMADLAVIITIGSFGYLFKPKSRFNYFMVMEIFFTAICVINSIYYTFYTSFASVSMLSLTQYLGDVGDAVVENVVQLKDLVYILGPIILLFVHLKIKKKNYYKNVELKSERKKKTLKTLATGGFIGLIFVLTMTSLDVTRFVKQWNKEYIVMRFGIYVYQANDLITSVQPKINSMFGYDKAKKNFDKYFENTPDSSEKNEYSNIFEGKNVIAIHAESMMNSLIDMQFNGQEVTPNLNRLAHTGMYFSNFYAQVGVGTSSDTELTLNTTLMPTKSGTAFVSYSDRTYNSTEKLLNEKGYYTFSMHANNADFWNRRNMHKSLGYKRFYSKSDYEIKSENIVGLGLSDYEFFKQSIPKIKKINEKHKNWYGNLIMLSNHTPFSDVEKYGEFDVDIKETIINDDGTQEEVVYPYLEGRKLGNYFKSSHYADGALGQLIDDLDNEGLLENTIIVLYGDHDSRLSKSEWRRYYNYNKETDSLYEEDNPNYVEFDSYQYELGRKVPLIIWSKDMEGTKLNQQITDVMGMYDVQPTLGNMMNFYNKYGLGKDIFNIKENNIVVFPNGNWVTNKVYYNSQKEEYLSLSNEAISEEEIARNTEYTNKLLDVSNDIIVFNLLKNNNEGNE